MQTFTRPVYGKENLYDISDWGHNNKMVPISMNKAFCPFLFVQIMYIIEPVDKHRLPRNESIYRKSRFCNLKKSLQ